MILEQLLGCQLAPAVLILFQAALGIRPVAGTSCGCTEETAGSRILVSRIRSVSLLRFVALPFTTVNASALTCRQGNE